jgi:hypothetical protein
MIVSAARREPGSESIQERVLGEFAADLRAALGRLKYVRGAFFAGSAANREMLTVLGDPPTLLGDVEVGFVAPLRHRVRVRELIRDLGCHRGLDVDAFLVTPRRLRMGAHRNFALSASHATVFSYEIGEAADWIFGRGYFAPKRWNVGDLHPWEGARLLLNRFGEAAPWLGDQRADEIAPLEYRRWLVKALVAAGDAILIAGRLFAPSYGGRQRLWAQRAATLALDQEVSDAISWAYAARTAGIDVRRTIPGNVWVSALRIGLSKSLEPIVQLAASPTDTATLRGALSTAAPPALNGAANPFVEAAYDSLLRIPRLRSRHLRAGAIVRDWRGRGCLQHWAYAPFAVALLNATSPSSLYAEASLEVERYLRPETDSHRARVRLWWELLCR